MSKPNKSVTSRFAKKTFTAAMNTPLIAYQPAQAIDLGEAPVAHVSDFRADQELQAFFQTRAEAMIEPELTTEILVDPVNDPQSLEDDLDAALASIEIDQAEGIEAEVLSAETDESLEETQPDVAASFVETMNAFNEAQVAEMSGRIHAAIDDRSSFETAKNGTTHNIHKTIAKVRKALMWQNTSRVMLAAKVDPAFINRALHDGSRYNVYAVDKVADAVRGIAEGVVSNAINRACMVSLFQMRRAGLPFTGEVAKACASDKHHIDLAIRKHLMRHTVSASTAPTQASSTMQALETLGIVRREGTTRNPTFHLTDSPIVDRLEEVLFARAA